MGEEAKAAIRAGDEIIIITNPEMSAVTDALKAIKLAEQLKKEVIGVIITRHSGNKIEMDIETIQDMLEVPILGVVPEDMSVKESQVSKNAVIYTHPKSKAAKAYYKATKRVLGPEYIQEELQEADKKSKGLFGKLFSLFR